MPVVVPDSDEYVTKGAAMQAVSALTGEFPAWSVSTVALPAAAPQARIVAQHEAGKSALGYA